MLKGAERCSGIFLDSAFGIRHSAFPPSTPSTQEPLMADQRKQPKPSTPSQPPHRGHTESRRDFFKTSAGVIAGVAAASMTRIPAAYAAGDETIKIALVGCGGRGTGACGQALSTSGPTK